MAFGVVHHIAGATAEHYEMLVDRMHCPDGSLREGQTFHLAGPTGDGWIVVALFHSADTWEQFRDEALLPAFRDIAENGDLPAAPEEITFEVHKLQIA